MKGYVVVTEDRRLGPVEWVQVHLLRRLDPRCVVYPVEAHPPPGPDAPGHVARFTVTCDSQPAGQPPTIDELVDEVGYVSDHVWDRLLGGQDTDG